MSSIFRRQLLAATLTIAVVAVSTWVDVKAELKVTAPTRDTIYASNHE